MEDIDLNLDDFIARVNSDLVGKYVNIASRWPASSQALRRQLAPPMPMAAGDQGHSRSRRGASPKPTRPANSARRCAKSWR
jgi:hypothetical protein